MVQHDIDDFYFFSPPSEFVLTHLPEADLSAWQLLDLDRSPLTLDDFENLVHVKSAFFRLGLRLVTHHGAVLKYPVGGEEDNTVDIKSPANKVHLLGQKCIVTKDVLCNKSRLFSLFLAASEQKYLT